MKVLNLPFIIFVTQQDKTGDKALTSCSKTVHFYLVLDRCNFSVSELSVSS